MAVFDQAKMVMQLRKVQKELENEIVEVAAGDDAVVVQVSGALKLKKVTIDPDQVDLDDIQELERQVEVAVRDALKRAQELAAEKMKPYMGGLGNLGM
jgi:DNA-binding YbaB/EbfC family protein